MKEEVIDIKVHFQFTEAGFIIETRAEIDYNETLRYWISKFTEDKYKALYDLGFEEKPSWLDTAGSFLYLISEAFQKYLLRQPDIELLRDSLNFNVDSDIQNGLLSSAPFAPGSEYINESWIAGIFIRLYEVYAREIRAYDGSVSRYFAEKSQSLRVPERIFFHLVENAQDEECPFAFLATYSTRVKGGRVSHKPLQYALTEYKNDREKLIILLSCLNQASEASGLINEFVRNGEMFHPLRLNPKEAYRFLKDVPAIEETGIICRLPNWWKKHSSSVFVNINIGQDKVPMLGLDTMVSMVPELVVDGMPLSSSEIEELLQATEGLAFLKGKWIEVDHARLSELIKSMDSFKGELTLKDALRMQLGEDVRHISADIGALITNGTWLNKLLNNLCHPGKIRQSALPRNFMAKLRPYQNVGYTWLNYMNKIGFGACLADDMGLGKTVQILAFLQKLSQDNKEAKALLIVPASLLGNWEKEIEKFAPKLNYCVLHGGGRAAGEALLDNAPFLTITTYGMTHRVEQLDKISWDVIILDEAQAIKNPVSKQTRRIKALRSRMRIAMTGTPIENDLSNLWSLFDFLNKGLLGSSAEFHDYCLKLDSNPEGYSHLKDMISPFMLRRLKTDKSIISDLPDKLEQVEYVAMSKKQTVLYRKFVFNLEKSLTTICQEWNGAGLYLLHLPS